MSGDRLSAERERDIREGYYYGPNSSYRAVSQLCAELDAVRADLAQARKERDEWKNAAEADGAEYRERIDKLKAALAAAREAQTALEEACNARGLPVSVQALIDHERNNGKLEGAFEALAGGGGDQ